MLDSRARPNWVNEISATLSKVAVLVRAAEASETTNPTAKPQYGWLIQHAERSSQHKRILLPSFSIRKELSLRVILLLAEADTYIWEPNQIRKSFH
jgi:hypothetical protein